MKANELMIEDWVRIDEPDKYAGATGQIQSLICHREDDAAYFNVFIQGKFGYVSRDVCSDDIRPIPLTTEILEKNGFRIIFEGELHTTYFQDIDGFAVEIKIDCIDFTKLSMSNGLGYRVVIECKYVHHLQHALRLCGITHEIIL